MCGCAGVVAVEKEALVHADNPATLSEVVVEEQQVLGHALQEKKNRSESPALHLGLSIQASSRRPLSEPSPSRSQPADYTPSCPSLWTLLGNSGHMQLFKVLEKGGGGLAHPLQPWRLGLMFSNPI